MDWYCNAVRDYSPLHWKTGKMVMMWFCRDLYNTTIILCRPAWLCKTTKVGLKWYFWECPVAQLGKPVPHVQKIRRRCSGHRFDSTPGKFLCHSPFLSPSFPVRILSCLSIKAQKRPKEFFFFLEKKKKGILTHTFLCNITEPPCNLKIAVVHTAVLIKIPLIVQPYLISFLLVLYCKYKL